MRTPWLSVCMVVVLCSATAVNAAGNDCRKIANATKRLTCFDAEQKQVNEVAKQVEEAVKKKETEQAQEREKQIKLEGVTAAKAAIRALKKVESRVQVGISYRDYPSILGDAVDAVREFQDSKHAGAFPATQTALANAVRHYRTALTVWQEKFSHRRVMDSSLVIGSTADLLAQLQRDYPNIDTATYSDSANMWGQVSKFFVYDVALSLIWSEASSSIKQASDGVEAPMDSPTPRQGG